MTTTSTADRSTARARLAIIGVVTACALVCSLPLVAGAGLLASAAAIAPGTPWIALALFALTAGAITAWWVRRRRRATVATSSGCVGGCGC